MFGIDLFIDYKIDWKFEDVRYTICIITMAISGIARVGGEWVEIHAFSRKNGSNRISGYTAEEYYIF